MQEEDEYRWALERHEEEARRQQLYEDYQYEEYVARESYKRALRNEIIELLTLIKETCYELQKRI